MEDAARLAQAESDQWKRQLEACRAEAVSAEAHFAEEQTAWSKGTERAQQESGGQWQQAQQQREGPMGAWREVKAFVEAAEKGLAERLEGLKERIGADVAQAVAGALAKHSRASKREARRRGKEARASVLGR